MKRITNAGGDWQIEELLSDGKPRRAYYFRKQLAIRLELSTTRARRLAGLTLVEKDIRTIKRWLAIVQSVMSEFPFVGTDAGVALAPSDDNAFTVRALYVAIVTTYAKMFTTAEGRGLSLDRNGWVPQAYRGTHDFFIQQRNNFTAHSGRDGFEECKVVVAIDYSPRNRVAPKLFTELQQPASIGVSDLVPLSELLDHLHAEVAKKLQKAIDVTYREFIEELTKEKLRALRRGASGKFLEK